MTPLDTIKGNLSSLSLEEMHLFEKRLYEISELSRVLYGKFHGISTVEDAEAVFHRGNAEEFFFDFSNEEGIPNEYVSFLRDKQGCDLSCETSALAIFLAERFRADGRDDLFHREKPTHGARIAYVPAGRAERAYFALADRRHTASVYYAASAADAVAALLAHQADYAMLPFMAANGEILSGTERLWLENDLSLSALVTLKDGEGRLAYAVFSSTPTPYVETDAMSLSISVTADSYAHLGRILSAIPAFGYTQTALSVGDDEYGRVHARLTLCANGDFMALWLYLLLYSVNASLLGRYPTIEI